MSADRSSEPPLTLADVRIAPGRGDVVMLFATLPAEAWILMLRRMRWDDTDPGVEDEKSGVQLAFLYNMIDVYLEKQQ